MLDWLESIANFFTSIISFIVAFFTNVIEICVLIGKGFLFASTAVSFMPIQYQIILLAMISFSVIVTIIHFGG